MTLSSKYISEGFLNPFPIDEVIQLGRKKHWKYAKYVKEKLTQNAGANSSDFAELLKLMIDFVKEDVTLLRIDTATLETFFRKIDELNEAFRQIDNYMKKLSMPERRKVWTAYIDSAVPKMEKAQESFARVIEDKLEWDDVDPLMISYFKLYVRAFQSLNSELKTCQDQDVDRILNTISVFILVYQPVIYAHASIGISKEVVTRRLSEILLSFSTGPDGIPTISETMLLGAMLKAPLEESA